ncbi:hypothetical protein dsx2_0505 [Desulfovibrio sp. X2]|uniref:hypothetical protein n=1 Tax=Desulfovibrio sp. X2 TaxID=941449 RepID=UPI000358D207|nr:hypothetical protein [Desulfovibrio sp. X2]EPR38696.1 hypothetical protein dsx2_0505 [Desulfovibrio sp. X2]
MDQVERKRFVNDDSRLRERAAEMVESRRAAGLDGLVGGLETVIICVEPHNLRAAAGELLRTTGLSHRETYEDAARVACVLGLEGSADFLVTCRTRGENPFLPYNLAPKSRRLPNSRLETFVYKCRDIDAFARIQKERGVRFMTEEPLRLGSYDYIQTPPSPYTGNALGFIQWRGEEGRYLHDRARALTWRFEKPDLPFLSDIRQLDHTATRVKAEERDEAILEFMSLTGYDFDFAIYVESLNSITSVARLSRDDYAQVFTSGITAFTDLDHSGPTEKYIHNYGLRVHHMAFHTENIDEVFAGLKADGMKFLVELVGSPEDGLKQTFSETSPLTFLVNEYIHRYGDFDGFFTRSNVTELTRATDKQ